MKMILQARIISKLPSEFSAIFDKSVHDPNQQQSQNNNAPILKTKNKI